MARLPYVTRDSLPPEEQELYDRMASPNERLINIFAVLMHSPKLARRIASMVTYLLFRCSETLSPQAREIVILTTARELECQYEWTHHIPWAKKVGLRDEVVEAIRDGLPVRRLLPKEGVFVQFARELVKERRVQDATFNAVLHLLGPQGTMELTVTVGYYAMLAHVMPALQVDLEQGLTPLLPEKGR
ncbi:MAG: carboxymuconolactone decarboxylase family protein [Chloroflexi bacterium]|nr:carboxymuconolactone decarboxylase family protein [Chloroflexota bacterium]